MDTMGVLYDQEEGESQSQDYAFLGFNNNVNTAATSSPSKKNEQEEADKYQAFSVPTGVTMQNFKWSEDVEDESDMPYNKEQPPQSETQQQRSSTRKNNAADDNARFADRQSKADRIVYDEEDDDEDDDDEDDDDEGFNEEADQPYHKEAVPPHACRYCLYHDPLAVAKCNICKKWFCNSRFHTSGSHILFHLIHAKHKEVALHPESPLGDSVLECYVCGNRNIFLLGFIPSKQESVVVLLCREPCLNDHALMDMDWDPSAWLPLIDDKQLLPWLVEIPKQNQLRRCRVIENNELNKLEELWKLKPDGDLEDLNASNVMLDLPEIPFHFQDGYHFLECFTPALDAEEKTSQEMKESIAHDNITIQWERGLNEKRIAEFQFPQADLKLSLGDELLIMHKETKWEGFAILMAIQPSDNAGDIFKCEMKRSVDVPTSISSNFTVKFVWNGTTFNRMKLAMKTMASEETSLSAYLYHRILGHVPEERSFNAEIPKDINAPNLAQLNYSQQLAVKQVLKAPLSLIQGPPGTGKTVTSATLVFHMCQVNHAQILVCAPSNVAVDHLTERIALTGLRVVRMASKSRESVESSIDHLMLHKQVRQFCEKSPAYSKLNKLFKLYSVTGDLSASDRAQFKKLLKSAEEDLLAAADVICCTCSGAGDPRLGTFRFKHVLIDEATQATEPDCLIPIVRGAKQLILVGDHCQMGPTVLNNAASKSGFGRSMFERLVMLGVKPMRLDVQYRMHPCLSEFSSNHFYEGTLQNGVTAEERDSCQVFLWPNPRKPMFFYNSIGPEEVGNNGTSYLNRTEAALAEKFLTQLLKNGVKPDEVGVITPYEGQRMYLMKYIQRSAQLSQEFYKRVEIASVDSFQGREKEYIIMTCVRSSDHQGIGFLNSWQRLNVSLTRAKRGIMVIGNARVLSRHILWHALITHYKEHELLVDGPIQDMKPINVALQKPRQTTFAIGPDSSIAMYQSLLTTEPQQPPNMAGSGAPQEGFGSVNAAYTPGLPPARHFSTGTVAQPASQASMSGFTQSQSQD